MRKLDTEWDGEGEEGGAEVVETSLEEALGAEGRLHAQVMMHGPSRCPPRDGFSGTRLIF